MKIFNLPLANTTSNELSSQPQHQNSPLENIQPVTSGSFFSRLSPNHKKRFIAEFAATTGISISAVIVGDVLSDKHPSIAFGANIFAFASALLGSAVTGTHLGLAYKASQTGQIALP